MPPDRIRDAQYQQLEANLRARKEGGRISDEDVPRVVESIRQSKKELDLIVSRISETTQGLEGTLGGQTTVTDMFKEIGTDRENAATDHSITQQLDEVSHAATEKHYLDMLLVNAIIQRVAILELQLKALDDHLALLGKSPTGTEDICKKLFDSLEAAYSTNVSAYSAN